MLIGWVVRCGAEAGLYIVLLEADTAFHRTAEVNQPGFICIRYDTCTHKVKHFKSTDKYTMVDVHGGVMAMSTDIYIYIILSDVQ